MPATTSTVIGKSKSDLKAQTRAELLEIVKPVVSTYVIAIRGKCWDMVDIAYEVKKRLGEGADAMTDAIGIFRECLSLEYCTEQGAGDYEKNPRYASDCKLVAQCVKIAFAFPQKQLAKKREQLGFNAIYGQIPKDPKKPKQSAKAFANALEQDAKDGVTNADSYAADVKAGMPVKGINTVEDRNHPTSWTTPETVGKRPKTTFEGDDWREESLAIISDQFDRFLAMIKQAIEKELTRPKRDQILVLIK